MRHVWRGLRAADRMGPRVSEPRAPDGATRRVGGLVVDPRQRGDGVGRWLLETGERWADTNGLTVIRLKSNSVRSNAHRFYERRGYSVEKTLHTFVKQVNESGSGGIV
jgi:GNAT superfamily N-acetyltransferase